MFNAPVQFQGDTDWFNIPPAAGFSLASGGYILGKIKAGFFSFAVNGVQRTSGSGQATLVSIAPWCQPGIDIPVSVFIDSGATIASAVGATGLLRGNYGTGTTFRCAILGIPIP